MKLLDNAREAAGDLDRGLVALDLAQRGELLDARPGLDEPLDDFAFNNAWEGRLAKDWESQSQEIQTYLLQCRRATLASQPAESSTHGMPWRAAGRMETAVYWQRVDQCLWRGAIAGVLRAKCGSKTYRTSAERSPASSSFRFPNNHIFQSSIDPPRGHPKEWQRGSWLACCGLWDPC